MKSGYLLAISLISNFLSTDLIGQNGNAARENAISNKLDEYLTAATKLYQFNGAALVANNVTILLNKGYGWKDASAKTLNSSNCIFQIGSMTKTFTAAVILKLQELGELSIYDPIVKYVPDFPNGSKITLQQLLTHTSGIFSINPDETDTVTWTPVTKNYVLSFFENQPLGFEPGTKFSYSNSGYYLLGMVIEKVTGHPYEEVVRNLIFDPLKMTNSGFDFIHLEDTLKASGYGEFNADHHVLAHLVDSTVSYAAGGMYSTTGDLYKWARAIATRQILSASSWTHAFTPFKETYGYGWFIDSLNGSRYVGHGGGIYGFTSYLIYFPDQDITIILLNNFLNETATLTPIVQGLSAILLSKPYHLPRSHDEFKISDSILNRYIGTYSLASNPRRTLTISKEKDHLIANLSSKTILELVFQTDTKFEFKGVTDATCEFIIQDGQATKFLVSQNGEYEWKKIK
jgi:CubicO group peptidase (beta-lactamase class C family)